MIRKFTPEERAAGNAAAKARHREKTRTVTVDKDLVGMIDEVQTRLQAEYGFKPTLSQTLRHLINKELKT